MSKSKARRAEQTKQTNNPTDQNIESNAIEDRTIKIKKLEVQFKTKAQETLWNMIDQKEIIICAGSAGTGKSHIALLKALDLMQKLPQIYKKMIITTPAIEADERLGYLPGTISEKLAPYMYSSLYILKKILGEQKVSRMLDRGHIEIMALAYMRGINVDNSILICDEFQNTTPRQAKTLLTRIGENSKFILNGDLYQNDRENDFKKTGLYFSMQKLINIPQIGIFEFADTDIIRNKVISIILKRFNGDVD